MISKIKKIKFEKSSVSLGKAVGELVIGLAPGENISKHDNDMKNNNWKKLMGNLLYGKNFGIIG